MRRITRDLDLVQSVKYSADAVYICVLTPDAAFVTRFGNLSSGRFVAAIESHFIKQFLSRFKELCLSAFFEEFLMLFGAVSQKKAATSRYFESSGGVLIPTDFSQQPETNTSAGECTRIVIGVDLPAPPRFSQQLVSVDSKGVASGKLL